MRKNFIISLISLLIISLSACTAISTETSRSHELSKQPGKGLAMLAVEPFSLAANKGYKTHIWIRNAKTKEHITSTRGKIPALSLAPGEYEFFKITVFAHYVDKRDLLPIPSKRVHQQEIKPLKFKVKAGKVIYAGNFKLVPNYDVIEILSSGKNTPSDIKFSVELTDQREQDIAAFLSEYKNINKSNIDVWMAR